MGSEYFINSQILEDKVRQVLPSQGGAGAGFDLSASTQIVPIIDLTEASEGSVLRQDLQSALAHTGVTTFYVTNASNTVIVTTTGYFRVFGISYTNSSASADINLFDGTTSKNLIQFVSTTSGVQMTNPFDFIVKISAGESLRINSTSTFSIINGNTRQIADIDGNLTNP
jgi:hypothetical protein